MRAVPWLSLIILAPWVGALSLALLPRLGAAACRALSLAFSLTTLGLALVVLGLFDRSLTGCQLAEHHPWIATLHVHYHLGLDGMSLLLVLLTGIVAPAALLAAGRHGRVNATVVNATVGTPLRGVRGRLGEPSLPEPSRPDSHRSGDTAEDSGPRLFGLLFLVLQGSALGVFLALDFVPWFLFWELSLVPAYFLIKLWGGPGAAPAAFRFFVYTLGGSAFLLLGFAALFAAAGSFDFTVLAGLAATGELGAKLGALGGFWPQVVFGGVFLGLAVKAPLYPFHSWLPSAYAEAPTGVSMFLTAVMSKMGVYGFLRILWPLFPAPLHAAALPLLWLALGGAVLGAFAAMRQTDLKRMLAYSSLNHVSYCLVALFAVAAAGSASPADATARVAALDGILLQMFNHGVSAAALFFCVGVLERRAGGRRGLGDFGGVRSDAPILAGLAGIALFSSLGLPGLGGFVGEFLLFRGVFGLVPWAAAIACLGLLATAIFLLTFWQRVFHGPPAGARVRPDLTGSERAVLIPLVALMFLFGVLPQLLTGLFNPLATAWAGGLFPP